MSENLDNNNGGQMMAPASNGMATGALIMGIIAAVLAWIPLINVLAWILGILAIIFGIIGIVKAGKMNGLGKGKAMTGLILGILAIVFFYVSYMLLASAVESNLQNEFQDIDWDQIENSIEELENN